LFLNIQGHNKKSIEKINGVSGSYELIEKSIDNILSAGLYLGANIVPFKANYKLLPRIFDYCRNKSFNEVSFLRFVPQGRGINRDLFNTRAEFACINESMKSILQKIQNEKIKIDIRLGHPINFLFLTGSEKLYSKEETHYCRGGDAPLILPSGDVSICPAWKNLKEFSVGNIYRQNFEEIWESYYFNVIRDFIKQGYKLIREPCRSCEYLESCRGKCVAQRLLAQKHKHIREDVTLEELLLFAPDPQCFKHLVGR
jgi:pyrroloquinoline quinone biosynthesis protein E